MKTEEKKKLLRILELDSTATKIEIEKAYKHLYVLYSNRNSPELMPLGEEFSEDERKEILSEIETAYEKLTGDKGEVKEIDFSQNEEILVDLQVESYTPDIINGDLFRKRREEIGLKLKEAAIELGVSFKLLGFVESEKFSKFDNDGYLRWIVMKYADFLNLDKKKATEDYMKLYRTSNLK